MGELIKRYFFYLIRWQLSTPLLAICIYLLTSKLGPAVTTILANFIGGLIFFWVDQWIFKKTDILFTGELWEVKDNVICQECGKAVDRGYRLVKGENYDRSMDKHPEFRCHDCSRKKYSRHKENLKKA
jgi:DNA-directed RNA polymerase subunit RPC12/RpoP